MNNREIKFRVWTITGMVKGRTIQDITTIKIPAGTKVESVYYPEDTVFMQYTGLNDKNGKEIYEGDIINSKPKGSRWNELMCKMVFNPTTARFEAQQYWPSQNNWLSLSNTHEYYEYEIIGNIHEHPELLK